MQFNFPVMSAILRRSNHISLSHRSFPTTFNNNSLARQEGRR